MRRVILLAISLVGAVIGDDAVADRDDLFNFLVELGHSKELANDVTAHICKLTDDPTQRRLSATHYMQLWHPESLAPEPAVLPTTPLKVTPFAKGVIKSRDDPDGPKCIDHIGCQDIAWNEDLCCPMTDGTRNGCCDFVPPVPELKPPMPHLDVHVDGPFLGPLQNVKCIRDECVTQAGV